MQKTVFGLGVVLGCSVACGGSSTKPVTTAPTPTSSANTDSKDGVVRPITQGQLKIAHYASGDMMTGLVLDRSGDQPKVRFDKAKDVIELTMVEDRHGGERRGWYMKSPDGKNVLYLSVGGGLMAFVGRDEVRLNSDKAADALPAPTIAGQYKAPESTYDKNKAKMVALALQSKNPDLTSEDAGNLTKVSEVLVSTPVEMFVRLTEAGAKAARYAPASRKIGNTTQGLGGPMGGYPTDEKWEPTKGTGLMKLGGKLVPMQASFGSPNRLRLHELKGWPAPLAAGTPGVVWEAADQIVFVTVDGGRYELSNSNEEVEYFEKGGAKAASWPTPNQHTLLDVDTIRGLAKGKAVPAELGAEIEAADDAWFECINGVWKTTKDQLDKIEASTAPANDKWGKASGVRKSAELDAPKKCEPTRQKLEKSLLKVIDDRATQRKAIFDKVRARF